MTDGFRICMSGTTHTTVGWILPLLMLGFLVLMLVFPQVQDQGQNGVLFYSLKGPGSLHAPLLLALIVGIGIGDQDRPPAVCER